MRLYDELADWFCRSLGQRLFQHGEPQCRALLDLAVVGLDGARDELEAGRFARAVATDEAKSFGFVDPEIGACKYHLIAVADGDFVEANESLHQA